MAFRSMATALAAISLVGLTHAWTVELPACTSSFQPFVYSGCFSDNGTAPALSFRSTMPSQNMTVETCVAECKGNGYRYAGLEYYGECFCGASVNAPLLDDSQCTYPCTGNQSETCGGNSKISVWQDTTFPPNVDKTTIADYVPLGCWTDDSSVGRALAYPQDQLNGAAMTTETCLSACKAGGFPFAGTEYSSECWCGVVIGNGTFSAPDTDCQIPCKGNSSEMCGGSQRLNMYVAKDLESLQPCGEVPVPPTSSSSTSSICSSSHPPPSSSWTSTPVVPPTTVSTPGVPPTTWSTISTPSIPTTPVIPPTTWSTSSIPSTPEVPPTTWSTISTPSIPTTPVVPPTTWSTSSIPSTPEVPPTTWSTPSIPTTPVIPPTTWSTSSIPSTPEVPPTTWSTISTPSIPTTPIVPPTTWSTPEVPPTTWSTPVIPPTTWSSTPSIPTTPVIPPTTWSTPSVPTTPVIPPTTWSSTPSIPTTPVIPPTTWSTPSVPTTPIVPPTTWSTPSIPTTPIVPPTTWSSTPSIPTTPIIPPTTWTSPSVPTTPITPPTTISSTVPWTSPFTTPFTTISKPFTSTPVTSSAICTTTVTVPPVCEYGSGSWCSSPIPDFTSPQGCQNAFSACTLQVAACFKNAGYPGSLDCFNFASWCKSGSSYCSNGQSGNSVFGWGKPSSAPLCSKSDFIKKFPPVNGKPSPVTTTTIVQACRPTTSIVPVPTPTGICSAPANPVGGIDLPVVTCNTNSSSFAASPFKLFTDSDSSKCPLFGRGGAGNACANACQAQYQSCLGTYAQGCSSNSAGGSKGWAGWKRDSYFAVKADKRTFGWTATYQQATAQCQTQYNSCVAQNKGVSGQGKCTSFGSGW